MICTAMNRRPGLLVKPPPGYTHASSPCAIAIDENTLLTAFAARDANSHSHIFFCEVEPEEGGLRLKSPPEHVLSPGPLGAFDSEGAIPGCFVRRDDLLYLYYSGWHSPKNVLHCNSIGRALCPDGPFACRREFSGPVLGRDHLNGYSVAAPFIAPDGRGLRMWYVSCVEWRAPDLPVYSIRAADSDDGIVWKSEREFCIIPELPYETNIARPSIIESDSGYHMLYCKVDRRISPAFRPGYAFSSDGRVWQRRDEELDFKVRDGNWDSDMICNPFWFRHKSWIYLLYNGNRFGKEGFGYASWRAF